MGGHPINQVEPSHLDKPPRLHKQCVLEAVDDKPVDLLAKHNRGLLRSAHDNGRGGGRRESGEHRQDAHRWRGREVEREVERGSRTQTYADTDTQTQTDTPGQGEAGMHVWSPLYSRWSKALAQPTKPNQSIGQHHAKSTVRLSSHLHFPQTHSSQLTTPCPLSLSVFEFDFVPAPQQLECSVVG